MSSGYCSKLGLFDRINNFVVDGANSQLTEDDWTTFGELLWESDEACQLYFRYVQESTFLQTIFDRMPDEDSLLPDAISWEPQDSANAVAPAFPANLWHGTATFFSSGWPLAYLVATVIFAIGALVGSLVTVSHTTQPAQVVQESSPSNSAVDEPKPDFVGRITGLVDCQWKNDECRMMNHQLPAQKDGIHPSSFIRHPSLVSLGDKFALTSGLLEITYNTGARVILQGPATYGVEAKNGGYLSLGKLTARVEKNDECGMMNAESRKVATGVHPSSLVLRPLFAVRTPAATITDLGTEFGVEVTKEGNTISHVFRGSVEVLAPGIGHTTRAAHRILHASESARIDVDSRKENRIQLLDPSVARADLIREIPKRTIKTLDLVDVVAGGDGFSGQREGGIDPTSGRIIDARLYHEVRSPISSDGRYHRVEDRPFVDGVFVPDGRRPTVPVDSAGHLFDGFYGSASATWQPLWIGGPMRRQRIPTEVGGVDYGSRGHALVLLHANNAITFDLETMRRANPGSRLLMFRAISGNVASGEGHNGFMGEGADAWVLIDGKQRFKRRQFTYSNGSLPVTISLGENDRFLTLAATDGGNGIRMDWVIFGDPRLELQSFGIGGQSGVKAVSHLDDASQIVRSQEGAARR